ncbi:MAG: hypothetical protein ACTSWX_09905 [Promethearchaeota archaeon]
MLIFYIAWYFIREEDKIFLLTALIVVGAVVFGLMFDMNKLLQGGTCKKCPNFACPMNKTPQDYFQIFLAKNQNKLIKNAWEKKKKD